MARPTCISKGKCRSMCPRMKSFSNKCLSNSSFRISSNERKRRSNGKLTNGWRTLSPPMESRGNINDRSSIPPSLRGNWTEWVARWMRVWTNSSNWSSNTSRTSSTSWICIKDWSWTFSVRQRRWSSLVFLILRFGCSAVWIRNQDRRPDQPKESVHHGDYRILRRRSPFERIRQSRRPSSETSRCLSRCLHETVPIGRPMAIDPTSTGGLGHSEYGEDDSWASEGDWSSCRSMRSRAASSRCENRSTEKCGGFRRWNVSLLF